MRLLAVLWLTVCVAVSTGCSLKKMAVNTVANTLSEIGTTFTSDEDVQLVGDALPFALKFYESILESTPTHQRLLLATCSAFTQYSYAYVEMAAEALPSVRSADIEALRDRALRLYLRGRGYCFRAIDARFGKGSSEALLQKPETLLAKAKREDVPLLYWTAASWGAAIYLGLDRPEIAIDLPMIRLLADRAISLQDGWGNGTLHELFITLDSLPEVLGGDPARARAHFEKAVALQKGLSPGPYVALSSSAVNNRDRAEFERLLKLALAVDPDKNPATRLVTLITQKRARLMLERIDEKFVN